MAKRAGKSHIVKRSKSFDQLHKGGKKAKLAVLNPKSSAGTSGNYWPLQYPFTEKGKNAGGLL